MKKYVISILLIFAFLLTSCAMSSEEKAVYDKLCADYPDGETVQLMPINSKTGSVDTVQTFFTNSKVKVTKVFYGDINEGDVIALREFYAVFQGEGSKLLKLKSLICFSSNLKLL